MGQIFPGGIHPYDGKELTCEVAIENMPLLAEYIVPLTQHIGAPAKLVVREGDSVKKGQLIAEPSGFVSAAIHSPTSGIITGISRVNTTGEMYSVNSCIGPTGTLIASVTIKSDGLDEAIQPMPTIDWQNADSTTLLARIKDAGIVGMGGAAFPTAVKLAPTMPVDTLIINGAECEPYLTADHRLMLENTAEVIEGIKITAKILGVNKVIVGIEDNKLDVVKALQPFTSEQIEVKAIKTLYPQGAEKQLIFSLTGRIVPQGKLPMSVGCVVQNVGSVFAIYQSVVEGISLIERITTVTGKSLVSPKNIRVRIGSPLNKVLEFVGGIKPNSKVGKIILGGPMMGMAQYSLDVPLMKNASGVLLLNNDEVVQYESKPCIRCGRCVDACPMRLMPSLMSVQLEKEAFEQAQETDLMSCIECGCCSFVCPSKRPLVQLFRRGKAAINQKNRNK
ncbi:MAG: electron transport complex subunit RsxC [Lentisphaeria bacterium]